MQTTRAVHDSCGIFYRCEQNLSVIEFVEVLKKSTLAERRPIDATERMERMLREADLIVTARNEAGELVGVARTLTDFSFCAYLSDLAVAVAYQGRGIGRELIQRTKLECGAETKIILLAAPAAETYYPHIGFIQHRSCWTLI